MADPLSITTGVLSLLGVCYKVGVELKTFCDGVSTVSATVKGMLNDIDGLLKVLHSMNDTFEQVAQRPTGHIGAHWQNISRSLEDGQGALEGLQELVTKVNKEVKVLDGPRKHVRMKSAEERINSFRTQVQSFRDALALSLQTVIL
jgi:hypothetical protein